MEGQRDLHATIDTHYIPYPPTIYTTLAGYGIAERDGERCESGRRVCLRIGTACDTVRSGTCMRYGAGLRACLRIGTARVRTDRDDERHGAGPDGERTVGTAFDMRCGYDRRVRTVRSEPRASVTEWALRALLDEFTAAVQALGATGGDSDLYGRLRVRLEA